MTAIHEVSLAGIEGGTVELSDYAGEVLLFVNVASRCGFTTQYEGLQELHERYRERGFALIGVPCNQFGEQEPGSASEIAEFCESKYSISFPMTDKLDVNGHARHPLYVELTRAPDVDGRGGDVEWNFEKFLVSRRGEVLRRFRSGTKPDAPELISALEEALAEPDREARRGPAPGAWTRVAASSVRTGDRVRLASGTEMTVSRIEPRFLGRDGMVCLIEDSDVRWLARPVKLTDELEVSVGS